MAAKVGCSPVTISTYDELTTLAGRVFIINQEIDHENKVIATYDHLSHFGRVSTTSDAAKDGRPNMGYLYEELIPNIDGVVRGFFCKSLTTDHLPVTVHFLTAEELESIKSAITGNKVVWSFTESSRIGEMVARVDREQAIFRAKL